MTSPNEGDIYHILEHANLGRIRGARKPNGVTQYLGMQYATLKDRFARGVLKNDALHGGHGVLDATEFGPTVLIPPHGWEMEQKLIQKSLPFRRVGMSDTASLTLNISTPSEKQSDLLPVVFFVHGGGFMTGSSAYPQNDLAAITRLSVEVGMPMVAVSINYRVGAPGFLFSSETGAAGYKPNNGLDDQRCALQWVRQNIAGFGGNPQRVTYLGESAGAASGSFLLHASEPMFHQLILMSGTSLLQPRPAQVVQKSFSGIAKVLGVAELSAEDQLREMLCTPGNEFVAKIGRSFVIGPIVDGDLIPETTTFRTLSHQDEFQRLFAGLNQCPRVLIGDCQMDGMIWGLRLTARTDVLPKSLERCLAAVFDPIDTSITPAIIAAYGMETTAVTNSKETNRSVLNFGNDVTFALPARCFAEALSKKADSDAFFYHFNCPNPWDGPWKGDATHALDLMFVLQNYEGQLSLAQQQCAKRFAKDIIAFVHGSEPWPARRTGSPGSMIYSAPAEGSEDTSVYLDEDRPAESGRRSILQDLVKEELYDRLLAAWQMFMRGPAE